MTSRARWREERRLKVSLAGQERDPPTPTRSRQLAVALLPAGQSRVGDIVLAVGFSHGWT